VIVAVVHQQVEHTDFQGLHQLALVSRQAAGDAKEVFVTHRGHLKVGVQQPGQGVHVHTGAVAPVKTLGAEGKAPAGQLKQVGVGHAQLAGPGQLGVKELQHTAVGGVTGRSKLHQPGLPARYAVCLRAERLGLGVEMHQGFGPRTAG
jgi:hypothetical protein